MSEEKPLVYLACPYSNLNPEVEELRYRIANFVAGAMMNLGFIVFSPISHCHIINKAYGLPGDWKFWQNFDRKYISVSHSMYVIRIPGWDTSIGVTAEIELARVYDIPVYYVDVDMMEKKVSIHGDTETFSFTASTSPLALEDVKRLYSLAGM